MFTSLREVAEANRAAGWHWFDKSAMRFFGTRLETEIITRGERQFFISSEQREPDTDRRYTIREVLPTGKVETVGEFMQYAGKGLAMAEVPGKQVW